MVYDEVNERTTSFVTVNFLDENLAPVTPSAATYRIDDEKSRTTILSATAFPSLSTSVDLIITSDENGMINNRKKFEIRTVTIEFDYGSPLKHGTDAYHYKLMNLYGVEPVPSSSPSASVSPS